jgi:hypothetical protein
METAFFGIIPEIMDAALVKLLQCLPYIVSSVD